MLAGFGQCSTFMFCGTFSGFVSRMGTFKLDMLPGRTHLGNVSRQSSLDHVLLCMSCSWHGSGILSLAGVQDGTLGFEHVARYCYENIAGTCAYGCPGVQVRGGVVGAQTGGRGAGL